MAIETKYDGVRPFGLVSALQGNGTLPRLGQPSHPPFLSVYQRSEALKLALNDVI